MLDPRDEVIVNYIYMDTARLEQSGFPKVAEAINAITNAVAKNSEISIAQRTEILSLLKAISKQAALPPQSRSAAVIRPVLVELSATMTSVRSLAGVWSTWKQTITRFFSS